MCQRSGENLLHVFFVYTLEIENILRIKYYYMFNNNNKINFGLRHFCEIPPHFKSENKNTKQEYKICFFIKLTKKLVTSHINIMN